jgi:N-carbamoyl-L-amino-acid hydrolase
MPRTSPALPAAMLFVSSIGGIGHHWAKDTTDADLAFDVRVLGAAAERVLAG